MRFFRFVLIGLLMVSAGIILSNQQIRVITPNGGETLVMGTGYPITWEETGLFSR